MDANSRKIPHHRYQFQWEKAVALPSINIFFECFSHRESSAPNLFSPGHCQLPCLSLDQPPSQLSV
jgi:hypothetical protein